MSRQMPERNQAMWKEAAGRPCQEGQSANPGDADARLREPSVTSWGHILRLLATSIGLAVVAVATWVALDSMGAQSEWEPEESVLFTGGIIFGTAYAVGSTCYGIAFWWRMFQRGWKPALWWFAAMVCVSGVLFVTQHPLGEPAMRLFSDGPQAESIQKVPGQLKTAGAAAKVFMLQLGRMMIKATVRIAFGLVASLLIFRIGAQFRERTRARVFFGYLGCVVFVCILFL